MPSRPSKHPSRSLGGTGAIDLGSFTLQSDIRLNGPVISTSNVAGNIMQQDQTNAGSSLNQVGGDRGIGIPVPGSDRSVAQRVCHASRTRRHAVQLQDAVADRAAVDRDSDPGYSAICRTIRRRECRFHVG